MLDIETAVNIHKVLQNVLNVMLKLQASSLRIVVSGSKIVLLRTRHVYTQVMN